MTELEFDEATHTYRLDGRRMPSVTSIVAVLHDGFRDVDPEVLAYAADKGTAVHLTTELDDRDDLDEEFLDPVLGGYLTAWRRFRRDTAFQPLWIEKRLVSRARGYAGTADRYGSWVISGDRVNTPVLIDIKTGATVPAYTAAQLAGYAIAIEEMEGGLPPGFQMAAVQLQPTGRYAVHRYPYDASIRAVFMAALQVHNWREAHR